MARVLIVLRLKSSVLGGERQMAQDYGREVGNKVQEDNNATTEKRDLCPPKNKPIVSLGTIGDPTHQQRTVSEGRIRL